MCLSLDGASKTSFRTTEDITSYKVVVERDGVLYAPFHSQFIYTLGEVAESEMEPKQYYLDDELVDETVERALHSLQFRFHGERCCHEIFQSIQQQVLRMFYPPAFADGGRCVLVECVIPAGSEVYRGFWKWGDSKYQSFASSKLKIVRLLG